MAKCRDSLQMRNDSSLEAKGTRLIHKRFEPETQSLLRLATADRDTTIQDYVAAIVGRELNDAQGRKDPGERR